MPSSPKRSGARHRPPFRRDDCIPQQRAIQAGKIAFRGLSHGHYPGLLLPPRALPGVRSLGCWDAVGAQDWGMEPHRNEGVEISLLETGSMDFSVEKTNFHLAPGTLTVTRPWQLHMPGIPHVGPGRFHWMILDVHALTPREGWQWPRWASLVPADLQELAHRLQDDRKSVWKASPEIVLAFRRLADTLARPDPTLHLSALMLNINHVLLGLLETLRSGGDSPSEKAPPSTRAVERFLGELGSDPSLLAEKWTLETMAKRCGVGTTALAVHCHALTNASPIGYLNLCRLSWAAERLRKAPDESITQIALQAGFSSRAYFATRFLQRYGQSPNAYRRKGA